MKKRVLITLAAVFILLIAMFALSVSAADTEAEYLTFSSADQFTLKTYNTTKNWDGVLKYSTDLTTWTEWDGTEISSSTDGKLYLTGIGNTVITGSNYEGYFVLSGSDISCTGNIMSLLDGQKVYRGEEPTMGDFAFYCLFSECDTLISAPELPAMNLTSSCYESLFMYCSALTTAPELPATTLADSCYNGMFFACSSLVNVQETLPATTLAFSCYSYMFNSCTALETAPNLPATTLANSCYAFMFKGCTNLKTIPSALPAETLKSWCYESMFEDCTSLVTAPELPATTLAEYCYKNMFNSCESLKNVPETLPATTLQPYCYQYMFAACIQLETAPKLPATTLAKYCYSHMFAVCHALKAAPELPAKTLQPYCYENMFEYSHSLQVAPELPATTLAEYCYKNMFSSSNALKTGPSILPATTLQPYCYQYMFSACIQLETAPELPATTLAPYCYDSMFVSARNLVNVQETLPATTLAEHCYDRMFYGCQSLEVAPDMIVTYADTDCCTSMFENCIALRSLPRISVTEFSGANNNAFKNMFKGCTGIKVSETQTDECFAPYSISVPTVENSNWTDGMLDGTGGPFTGAIAANTTYYQYATPAYLTFSSADQFTLKTYNTTKNWDGVLKYSTDLTTWTEWDGTEIFSSADGKLYLTGIGNTRVGKLTPNTSALIFTGTDISCSGNIMSLLDGQKVYLGEEPTMADYAFSNLFYGCNNLISAPTLPAMNLTAYCYTSMFHGSGITTAPELPATILAEHCYDGMFYSCKNLTTAPELTATTLAAYCYYSMFGECTNLQTAPELSATTLAESCYDYMFYLCTNLVNVPEILPATELALSCYRSMFNGCSNLQTAPALPATTLAENCYNGMFKGCASLTTAPALPAETLQPYCYQSMFEECSNLEAAPELNATALAKYCYSKMFVKCENIVTAPALPAETLQPYCYQSMFENCSKLETAPLLPATTLAEYCYNYMFAYCGSMTTAPELNATTLAEHCYDSMFVSSWNLVNVQETLPATKLAPFCYHQMFAGTAITTTPKLPATNLETSCYERMFSGCSELKTATELPATNLAACCYYAMFYNCQSLEVAPDIIVTYADTDCCKFMFESCKGLKSLPKISVTEFSGAVNNAFNFMFRYCTGIKLSETKTDECFVPYSISVPTVENSNWTNGMLDGTGGPFTGAIAANTTYYQYATPAYLTFSSADQFTLKTNNTTKNWDGVLKYSTDLTTWTEWDGTEISSSTDGKLYLTGIGNTVITGNNWKGRFVLSGSDISSSGNIMSLLDGQKVYLGEEPAMGEYAFSNLFRDCQNLTSAPELPAMNLTKNCYSEMFHSCSSLKTAPELPATTMAYACYWNMFSYCSALTVAPELKATTLANYCYQYMFGDCSNLITAPALPAETLAAYCYEGMFSYCTSLEVAPELPATTLATECYEYMFEGCNALKQAPKLPATTLANNCYSNMFKDCTSLVTAPELNATTLADYCYSGMFKGCTSLKAAPALPATTLKLNCYLNMFHNCTSLETAADLHITSDNIYACSRMYSGCTSLKKLPSINFETANNCILSNMFANCTGIKISETQTADYSLPFNLGTTDTSVSSEFAQDMFIGTGGTFTGSPEYGVTYYQYCYHEFTEEVVADEYLKTPADCSNAAVYYKSCACGTKSETETFTSTVFDATKHTPGSDGDCSACGAIAINEAHFPDAAFRDIIAASYDPNADGYLSSEERASVTDISVSNITTTKTTDLTGIELFTELKTLTLSSTALSSIDLTQNTLLERITISHNSEDLNSLKLTGLVNLKTLSVTSSKLTALDVSTCTNLETLYCQYNKLRTLDVSSNANLKLLEFRHNAITQINLSGNTALTNVNDGTTSGALGTGGYLSREITLGIGEVLDLSKYGDISKISNVTGGNYDATTGLLTPAADGAITVTYDYATGFGTYAMPVQLKFEYLAELPVTADYFPDDTLRRYVSEFDKDGNGKLSPTEIANSKSIYGATYENNSFVWETISSLKGLEYLTNFVEIKGFKINVKEVDFSMLPKFASLEFSYGQIERLILAGCSNVSVIYLSSNMLSYIDLTGCTMLRSLDIRNNKFTSLDLTGLSTINNFKTSGNGVTIEQCGRTVDMNQFGDITRMSNIGGATMDANGIATLLPGSYSITYDYDTNHSSPDVSKYLPVTITVNKSAHTDADSDKYCDICGDIADASGAKHYGSSVTLGGAIGVNFYMELSADTAANADAYMLITVNGESRQMKVSDAATTTIGSKTYYIFTCKLKATQMADIITAKMVVGSVSSPEITYSVTTYANNIITANKESAETIALIKAMLNYGATAQLNFGYNTDNLANAILSEEDKAIAAIDGIDFSAYTKSYTANIEGLTYYGSSLILESNVAIRHYFTFADGASISDYEFKLGTSILTPKYDSKYAMYYVAIPNIPAIRLDDMYTLTVSKIGTTETQDITYGAFSYILNIGAQEETVQNVVKAMYWYNIAVEAYNASLSN